MRYVIKRGVATYVVDEYDTTILDLGVDFFNFPIRFKHPTQVLFCSVKLESGEGL